MPDENVIQNSPVVEMSLRITKASYNKSEDNPRRWAAVDSDTDEDLYKEKMSLELYQDFTRRIKDNVPVPEQFKSIICEDAWCGGMPYLSIAHYKAGGNAKNVPGDVERVYVDGNRLKSGGTLHDSDMGRKVFDSLVEDLYKKKSGDTEHLPVRISIGFLDLEHKHRPQAGGQEFTFTRNNPGEICPLCSQGIGGKIYTKGQLVHLAMTRVPVNPRTEMNVERSMKINSKKQDAASILGEDLANELEEKSIASDMLVVRAEDGSLPVSMMDDCDECYDPNTGSYDQACVDAMAEKYVGKPREEGTVKSKALLDVVSKSLNKIYKLDGNEVPVVEESMASLADAKITVEVVDKGVLGIPEKPFNYAGIDGSGNNTVANPVKSEDGDADDEGKDKDAMEKSFAELRQAVIEAKSKGLSPAEYTEKVNKAFADLGTAVEDQFKPQSNTGSIDLNSIAEIVRSAVAGAVQPLQMELAVLKSQLAKGNTVSNDQVVKSKALTLGGYPRAEDMIQRAVPNQPQRKLSQIEEIALRSTGAVR